ncbi:MAG TPA: hypothetical protein VFB12_13335 [Ktedonobacteraceae bacterium]|nr:hypothetical protein [Ktedonobacteraceae bacterium]
MSSSLTREESEVVRALRDTGMSLPEATLAVIMFSRGHERSETELINILDLYSGLENAHEVQHAISSLKAKSWVITVRSYDQDITKAAPDLQEKMAQQTQNPLLVERLAKSRSNLTVDPPASIRLLGPMTSKDVYGTFLDLLRHARTEICLPMLATPAYPVTAAILQERARRNVHVRLLLASPDVAAKVRGGAIVEKARKAITEWKDVAQSHPQIEVRICHHVDDMCYLATSWTLDRHLLRYDIYDPKHQRSLAGYMIEFESRSGLDLNIVNWFQSRFDEAWNRSQPLHTPGRVWWTLTKNWQWWAFAATALLAVLLGTTAWGGIVGSVSATFLCNAVVGSWSSIRAFIHDISK